MKLGQTDQAIKDYSTNIALRPKSPYPYLMRGQAYLQMKKKKPAIADFDRAVKLTPNEGNIFNTAAWLLYLAGHPKDGLPYANRALLLRPKAHYIWDTRASIFEAMGLKDAALADWKTVLTLNPRSTRARKAIQRLSAPAKPKKAPAEPVKKQ